MKRIAPVLMTLILILCLPAISIAMTQEEWNQGCYTKTKGTTTIYSVIVNEETGEKETTPVGSLPSGTYIHENVYDYDLRMWEISWYPGGSSAMGWVSRDNLTDATKWVYYSDGSGDPLPEALVNNPEALKAYMDRVMPGYSLQGDGSKPVNPYSTKPEDESVSGEKSKAKATGSGSKTQDNGLITATLQTEDPIATEEQGPIMVEVRKLGITSSIVYRDGKEETVQTGDLSFAQNAPEGKELAVIFAPKAGYATMRKTASSNGKVVKKIKAGTIVLVLEIGEKWVKIQNQNQIGYIAGSCLHFYPSDTKAKATGTISYKGKTTVNTTVNIRNAADKGSSKVAEWKVGKEVTVLNRANEWVEIEADGICGYILDEFISITE